MKQTAKSTPKKLPLKKHVKRHIRMAVVPHKANQYRPHLIRRYGLIAILVAVLGLQSLYNLSSSGSILGIKADVTATNLLADANRERESHRLNPLSYSEQLSAAAYFKAQDMLKQQYWAHTAPDGTTPWHWLAKVDYRYAYAGENLAKNFTTAEAATTAWMASPDHRANILSSDYTDVGYAVLDGTLNNKPVTLIVSLFGRPATTASVAGASTPRTTTGPLSTNMSLMTRFGIALQSITPAALGSILLIMFVALIAIIAHAYRYKLPRAWRTSWRLHHGLLKAIGMASFSIVILFLYSGGQI